MFAEALAGLEMTVAVNGETHEAKFKPGDLIRFERYFNRPLSALAETDEAGNTSVKMEELAYLAFAALTRADTFDGDFDDFIDQLDDIELDGDGGDPPTPAAG